MAEPEKLFLEEAGYIFELFDREKRGLVDREKLLDTFMSLGCFTKDYFTTILKDIDFNNDGALNKEEFIHFVGMIDKKPTVSLEEMKDTFSQIDTDGDGLIEVSDLHEIFTMIGDPPPRDDFACAFGLDEREGRHTLEFSDFNEFIDSL